VFFIDKYIDNVVANNCCYIRTWNNTSLCGPRESESSQY